MASMDMPLPALHLITGPNPNLQGVAVPNQISNYAQLIALKQAIQEAPYRQQMMQQQAQAGQLQNQQMQQAMKDSQAWRSALTDPSNQGQTIGQIADTLARQGNISQQAWAQAKKQDIDAQTSVATLDDKRAANLANAYKATQPLYDNVMKMPDDQTVAQNWPAIATQYHAIWDPIVRENPQLQGRLMTLNPNQPLSKQQLQNFGPMLQLGQAYADQDLERRQKQTAAQTADVDLQLKQQQLQYGGNQQVADSRYRQILMAQQQGQPVSADDEAFKSAYEKQKLLVPQATAQVKIEGMQQAREYPVFDNQTKTTLMLNASDINAANRNQPGRYTVAAYTPEAIGQKDVTQYFTSGKGGQQLTAFNTAMGHLDTLQQLAGDLNNSNVQIFNKAAQAWAQQTGNPAPANFAAAKNAMSGEVAAALKASGATDAEIQKVGDTFSSAQSPAQLQGAINTYRTLLRGKAANLQQQYQQGMQGKPNFGGSGGGGTVMMRAPNGQTKAVPADQVDHYKRIGAVEVQ